MADRLLRVLLEIVPKTTGAFQKALGIGGGSGASAATSPQASQNLSKITSGFSDMHKQIALLNTAIRPDLIAKQAALEVKLAKATADYDKALGAAKPKGGILGSGISGGMLLGGAAAGLAAGIATVGARSPATMEKFERALLDVTAVIGETFTPVLEIVTDGVRLFGDILLSILPDAKEMREALKPISELLARLRDSAASVTPLLKLSLMALVDAVSWAADQLVKLLPDENSEKRRAMTNDEKAAADNPGYAAGKWIRESLGIPSLGDALGLNKGRLANSMGMAATPASYIGGEERGRAAYAAAFAQGKSIPERTLAQTELMVKALESIKNATEKFAAAGSGKTLDDAKEGR